MRKILLITALFSIIGLTANAQRFSYGVKAGAIFTNTTNIEASTQRIGVVAGVVGEAMVGRFVSVQSELLYAQRGWNNKTIDGTYKTRLDYIYMPILAKFYMIEGLSIQLGGQFGYLANGTIDSPDWNQAINSQLNKYSVDFLAGVSYEFNCGLILEGRYLVGLTDVVRSTDTPSIKTGGLQVTAGWRF